MAIKSLSQISGKVKRRSASQLDSDRYDFLSLSQAEPNPGVPDSDGALFFSDADGTRGFTTEPQLSGLSFKSLSLDSSQGEYLVGMKSDPFQNDGQADSIGVLSIGFLLGLIESAIQSGDIDVGDDLQAVTERGPSTTVSSNFNSGLTADSAEITNNLSFGGQFLDGNDRRLIIYDSTGTVLWGG